MEPATSQQAFDIDIYIDEPITLKEANVSGLGIVKYKLLTYDEMNALTDDLTSKGTSAREQGLYLIAAMMFKADGKTTVEKLRKLSGGQTNRLCDVLGKEAGLL